MASPELIPHLFRTEYRKIVSVLGRRFGFDQIETAEDIASDTFLTAAQVWSYQGVPPNPVAWLYHVAKNKAKNHLQRKSVFENKVLPEIGPAGNDTETDIDLSPENINDSQLLMMFAICRPSIPPEAQIGLSLRILCGFGIEEIADAFLTHKETINKRLYRAKEKLREEKVRFEIPSPEEMAERLDSVLTTIYLLFNEGYYSVSAGTTLRRDLCYEAIRLCNMLVENQITNKPKVNALMSLMCFHASRFDARVDEEGEMILYNDQDASRWDSDLISRGIYFMNCAASGEELSRYHLEAAIAYWHTRKEDTAEKWESILDLYHKLLGLEYSPVADLNRIFALSKVKGKEAAIREVEMLNLSRNHFYFMLLGELHSEKDKRRSKEYFEKALSLAKNEADRKSIGKRIKKLGIV